MVSKPSLELETAPASEPLVLADVKNYLKINVSDDDDLVTTLISTARQTAENYLKSALITQSWKLSYDTYTPTVINMLMGPVQSITSVTAIGRSGSSAVISSDAYYLSSGNERLIFDANVASHRIEIIYVTGYGASASDVPNPIKQGMLAHIGAIYDGRTGGNVIPPQAMALYMPYQAIRI